MRFLLLYFCCTYSCLYSQYVEKQVDSLFREDQIYLSVSYNIILNKPESFSQYSFSTGFTGGFLRDFPITKNRNWSIAPGIGYAYHDLKQNIKFFDSSTTIPDETIRSRLVFHYIELPIEFRWRNATPQSHKFWRIYAGIKFSYLIGGSFNFESPKNGSKSIKVTDVTNTKQIGAYLSFGFNTWNPYIYYGFNSIFDESKTDFQDKITVLNVGLKFYIL
jgi:hypothetical protein